MNIKKGLCIILDKFREGILETVIQKRPTTKIFIHDKTRYILLTASDAGLLLTGRCESTDTGGGGQKAKEGFGELHFDELKWK